MNTYFCLLDSASLFCLLVRLHYEDLMNLCKARCYLWKIVCTPYFQEEWKKYNIKVEIMRTIEYDDSDHEMDLIEHREVDRLQRQHGVTTSYDEKDGTLYLKCDYIQDIKEGCEIQYENDLPRYIRRFVNGVRHGQMRAYHDNGYSTYSWVNGEMHGIDWTHGYYLEEIQHSFHHGISVKWYPTGGLSHMGFYCRGRKHGVQREWYENGIKQREYTMVNGYNKGPSYQWDESGELIKFDEC